MATLPAEVADHLDKVVAATRLLPSTDRVQALDTAVSMLLAEQAVDARDLPPGSRTGPRLGDQEAHGLVLLLVGSLGVDAPRTSEEDLQMSGPPALDGEPAVRSGRAAQAGPAEHRRDRGRDQDRRDVLADAPVGTCAEVEVRIVGTIDVEPAGAGRHGRVSHRSGGRGEDDRAGSDPAGLRATADRRIGARLTNQPRALGVESQ
jgi:hypothetical protein